MAPETMTPTPADVRAARLAAALTQSAAAAVVHASLRAWQQWEAGDRAMHPGLWELFQIKTPSAAPTQTPQPAVPPASRP
jgi:putative transcriptional regulator